MGFDSEAERHLASTTRTRTDQVFSTEVFTEKSPHSTSSFSISPATGPKEPTNNSMYTTTPTVFDGSQAQAAAQPSVRKISGRRRHKHKPGNEALCKYASKACYNPRVVKKTGDLHRYCEHHRLQANRNQRRLEQRRRGKDRGDTSSGGDDASVSVVSYSSDNSSSAGSDSTDEMKRSRVHHQNLPVMIFEPFRHPVSLQEEDLYSLRSIFDEPQQLEETKSADTEFFYEL